MNKAITLRQKFEGACERRYWKKPHSTHSHINALYEMFPRDDDALKISSFKYKCSGGFEGDGNAYALFIVGDDTNNILPLNLEDIEAILNSLAVSNLKSGGRDYDRQRFFFEKVRAELGKALPDVTRFQNVMSSQSTSSALRLEKKLA